jgi:hypothetical protein
MDARYPPFLYRLYQGDCIGARARIAGQAAEEGMLDVDIDSWVLYVVEAGQLWGEDDLDPAVARPLLLAPWVLHQRFAGTRGSPEPDK